MERAAANMCSGVEYGHVHTSIRSSLPEWSGLQKEKENKNKNKNK